MYMNQMLGEKMLLMNPSTVKKEPKLVALHLKRLQTLLHIGPGERRAIRTTH
jgi:hypothetical protein